MSFKIGDVVMLKSTGPKMTVTMEKDFMYCCYWFAGNTLYKDYFFPESLKLIQSDKPVLRIPKL